MKGKKEECEERCERNKNVKEKNKIVEKERKMNVEEDC